MNPQNLLFIISLVLLILAGFNVASSRVSLGWFGMAFFVAGVLIGGMK
jgi:hypothetical protein